jgi:hypothetical protein
MVVAQREEGKREDEKLMEKTPVLQLPKLQHQVLHN